MLPSIPAPCPGKLLMREPGRPGRLSPVCQPDQVSVPVGGSPSTSRGRGRSGKTRSRKGGPLTADELVQVRMLVEQLGGEARLVEALEVLRQLK